MSVKFVLLILAISVLLQFTAAFLAFRLIQITGKRRAWLFIAAAISFMVIRRFITLFDILSGEIYQADLSAELVALATSILMALGVALIAPIFLTIKRSEKQTKQLQEYLQLQIERMPIGLIVWDTKFHVQSWNPAAEKIFGFTAEEALGKHPYNLIVPREAQPYVDNIWRRLLEGDMTAHSINENITKDGRGIICQWSNTPLRKADDTVVGVLSMVQDITERDRAEEALRASEKKYKTLFESAGEGILIADIETKEFKYANQAICKMLGYSEEQLLRLGVSDIHPKDALEHVISEFEAQARGEKTLALDIPCLRKDGTIIYADINTTKVLLDRRECNLGFFTDITERKGAEDALRKSEEERKKRMKELEEFYEMAVGRELRMKELKEDIERLKEKLEKYEKP